MAALDLFTEQGYDATAVAQIAERAGLTKTTFFRHFRDKREVLFVGQEVHARLLAEGVAAAPPSATVLEAIGAGVAALCASFTPAQRDFGPRLLAVVAGNPELAERSVYKRHLLAASAAAALVERGVPEPDADLAAELGVKAFGRAFARWVEPARSQSLPVLARRELTALREAAARLE
ncbi:TetR/AcrR family transcriptional regulator [Tsukamurella soli]|uniref:TetR/AcrR family transcriptional regulator n=2 Tax=Tsukamurella soli TaxID=644556 RepID=A0ABP8JKU0_9ACTN